MAPLSVDLTIFPEMPAAMKVSLPKPTPNKVFEVGEVALLKCEPLSAEIKMVPLSPAITKVLLPNANPYRLFDVGEVALSKEEPLSVDLSMLPEIPDTINTPEPERLSEEEVLSIETELLDESSLPPQEIMGKDKPTINKIYKIFFTNSLNKNNKVKVKK